MPGEFLSPSHASAPRRRRAPWTIAGSCVLHGALVTVILVLPALGALTLPPFTRPMSIVFASAVPVPPAPPAPAPARTAERPAVRETAPFEAPPGIRPEAPRPAVGPPGGVTTGLHVDTTGRIPDITGRGADVTWTPPPRAPIRPGGDILAPQRIRYVAPVYPTLARQIQREGTVILEAVIDETGAVRNVTVLRSVPQLDRAAIDAVSQWRYTPTRLNGVPVAIVMTVTVTFSLR
jgi:protein TonB